MRHKWGTKEWPSHTCIKCGMQRSGERGRAPSDMTYTRDDRRAIRAYGGAIPDCDERNTRKTEAGQ